MTAKQDNEAFIVFGLAAIVCLAAALVLLWQVGLPREADFGADLSITAPQEGAFMPPLDTKSMNGAKVIVGADMRGPAVVNFWATWCPPCVREMPLLQDLANQGTNVIAINVGGESPDQVAQWLAEHQLNLPVVMDNASYTLESRYRIQALPTTFFVSADGRVRYIHEGMLDENALRDGLARTQN